MCTMISEKADVKGSGKKTNNWIPLDSCDIYYDHSTYVDCEHSITLSFKNEMNPICLLYTSPSPRDGLLSRMPSSA